MDVIDMFLADLSRELGDPLTQNYENYIMIFFFKIRDYASLICTSKYDYA